MLILVTNDDGIHAPGIAVLADALRSLGQVMVVAPDRDRSAIGHALTLHAPLRAEEMRTGVFAVDGTPTDCVNLGVHGLLPSIPDLVVAGINRGANLGDDLTYSGTVCAAMEATLMGVPAFAVSLGGDSFTAEEYRNAGRAACFFARKIVQEGLPPDTFLNINVPPGAIRGMQFTRQGRRRYGDVVVEKVDPRGRKYYWLGGGECAFEHADGTDCRALHDGFISVTPLHLDLTNFQSFEKLAHWGVGSCL